MSMNNGILLACLDGSKSFQSVCDHAAWAAQKLACSVELLHVVGTDGSDPATVDLSGALGADTRDALLAELVDLDAKRSKLKQHRGRTLLDHAGEQMAKSNVSATSRLRNGRVVETVLEASSSARLLVLGKQGESAQGNRLGSHLESVVRSSKQPVLVVPATFQAITRFAIAFDGSPSAERAVARAAASPLLKGLNGHLIMVASKDASVTAKLDAAKAQLEAAGFNVTATVLDTASGHPEDLIQDFVTKQGISLLIMGAYGHSRIRQFMIGSTTTALLRVATVPVLLVR